MTTPTLDLVMPCHNTASVFALALAHVEAYALPTGLVRQVIVLDTGFTDPGMATMLSRLARHPRFRVLRHEANVGVWCSLNRGLALSGAEHVMVVMSDVLIGPDTVPVMRAVLQGSPYHFISPGWRVGMQHHADAWADIPPDVRVVANQYNGTCWAMRWSVLRTAVGWFDPRFHMACGDTDYVERLRGRGGFFIPMLLPEVTVTQQEHSMPPRGVETDVARFRAKWAEFPAVLRRHGEEVGTDALSG